MGLGEMGTCSNHKNRGHLLKKNDTQKWRWDSHFNALKPKSRPHFPHFFFEGEELQYSLGHSWGVLQGYSWLSAQVLPLVVMQWQGSELVSVLHEDTPVLYSPVGKI